VRSRTPIDNKLIAAVIDKLPDRDHVEAMTVIEVLLDEQASGFPKANAKPCCASSPTFPRTASF
jgi:hypothetical protein